MPPQTMLYFFRMINSSYFEFFVKYYLVLLSKIFKCAMWENYMNVY